MMNLLHQIAALVGIAIKGLRARVGNAFLVTFGIACSVGVLVGMLSIGAGIDLMVTKNVRHDRVVVRGSAGSVSAELPWDEVKVIETLPGIRRSAEGASLASAGILITVQARRTIDGANGALTIMGVGERFAEVHPEIKITGGRAFKPGMHEVIVGRSAQRAFRNLAMGDFIDAGGARWTVVGTFETAGDLTETRLIADAATVRSAFKRTGVDYMTIVRDPMVSLSALAASIKTSSQTGIKIQTEADIRKAESRQLSGLATFIGYFVGSIMAAGAFMGVLNSMYMLADSRRRDHATLRAIGFRPASIAAAVLIEALVLALPGAAIGVLVPWIAFNGSDVNFVGLNFSLAVTPQLAATGVICALTIALVGGSIPAIRAMLIPVATGLASAP